MKIRIILGMVAVLSVAQTVFADSTETLIPIDQNNSIFVFTQEMEQKGKVFTEYVNFLSATLYQLADGTFMLQVAYKADNTTMQRRQPMTPEEVQRLRQRVTSSILLVTQLTKITPDDPDGKWPFLTTSTLMGGYYAWASMYTIFDTNKIETGMWIGSFMVGIGGGFFLPFLLTYNSEVTASQSLLFTTGAGLGFVHGLSINMMAFGTMGLDMKYPRVFWGIPMLFVGLEAVGGYFAADMLNFDIGESSMVTYGTVYAGLMTTFAFATAGAFGTNTFAIPYSISLVLSTAAGAVGGYYLSQWDEYKSGDLGMSITPMMIGALAGSAIFSYFAPTNNTALQVYSSGVMIGATLGAVGGILLVRDKDFSEADAGITTIATWGGAALCAGIGALIKISDLKIYLTLTSVGAIAGYTFSYLSYSKKADETAAKNRAESAMIWETHFAPEVLIYGMMLEEKHAYNQNLGFSAPIFQLTASF